MRIGQTSAIVFASELVASLLGFLATVYFARILGAEVLGYYAIILAVAAWLKIGGKIGVSSALTKRLSEGDEQAEYITAATIVIVTLGAVVSGFVVLLQDHLDSYVGVNAALFLVLLVVTGLFHQLVLATLSGKRLVHISGLLSPIGIGGRSAIQIGLVATGWGLSGMVFGYVAGTLLVGVLGLVFLSVRLSVPGKEHFVSLYEYAKYAWLGGLKSRTWNEIDILILGAMVPASLVGIYSVAWGIAKFLNVFGTALTKTLFPELSRADAKENTALVQTLINDSLTYGGLILIPGLVGGAVLADRLLLIYGSEFTEGVVVFVVLVVAYLIYGYWKQLMNALKALDRPDLAFRINLVFILLNVSLNVLLILTIGWLGAAIATATAATVGLILAFRLLRQIVQFTIPSGEIARQWSSALLMGLIVYGARELGETHWISIHNELFVVALVILGAIVYFLTMLAISRTFRTTVSNNSPLDIPLTDK